MDGVEIVMNVNELIDKVIEKVTEREQELQEIYGANIEQIIFSAMEQYRDVFYEYEASLPVRFKALAWALKQYISESSRYSYAYDARSSGSVLTKSQLESNDLDPTKLRISPYNKYNFKCNKLIADSYAVGGAVGLSIGKGLGGKKIKGKGYPAAYDFDSGKYMWGPKANRLAKRNHNLRSLTYARELREQDELKAQPQLGDIICFPAQEGLGHSSLYLGKRLIISAKSSGVEIEREDSETEWHDGLVRIRKFTGSGR